MSKILFTDSSGSREFQLPETGAVFGRADDCAISILEGSVSGHHGRFEKRDGQWWIVDTGSSNGTKVNGVEVTESAIKNGDQLLFGDLAVQFIDEPEAAPEPAPEPAPAPAPARATASKAEPAPAAKPEPKPAPKPEPVAKPEPKPEPVAKPEPKPEPVIPEPAKPEAPAISTGNWKAPELKVDPTYKTPEMAGTDIELIDTLNENYKKLMSSIGEVVIGQTAVVEQVLTAVFARGHALLMGVPGLAKTLLISTLSHVLDLGFKRVQFTPDLMPSDITGTDVLEENRSTGERTFRFVKGPIFTNMLLADEINRTPPKTQAALLEAMQEGHITVGSQTYPLPKPFFVLATQNPIEQEGTYPLPEAQMDRFLFNIIVDYPSADDESTIIANVTSDRKVTLDKIMDGNMVLQVQDVVKRVPVAPHVIDFARNLVRATRPKQPEAPDFVREMVGWGAGPRAGLALINAGKARAVLHGRHHCTTADVVAVALPVLRHRCITTFAAEASGVTSDEIVNMLLKALKASDLAEI